MTGTAQVASKQMPIDVDDFKALIDAADVRAGHDSKVAALIAELDRIVQMLEVGGRVYKHRKHQKAGASGFRNVYWHRQTKRWTGRVGYTDADGKRHRKSTGYYRKAEDASTAVEELRKKLGLR